MQILLRVNGEMIAALEGKLVEIFGDDLVIDVAGVGYLVAATSAVRSRADKIGTIFKLVIYTDVKENSISLYGFDSLLERSVFLLLKKVKGIGSRIALTIVSSIGSERLLSSIAQGDVAVLQKVNGVGKRTAERLVVELREKVGELAIEASNSLPKQIQRSYINTNMTGTGNTAGIGELLGFSGPGSDAILALEKLGFSSDRASQAVKAVMGTAGEVDAGEILRQALAHL